MLLTVSKRLEFSASRRLHVTAWTEKENTAAFGPETSARYGSGRNYIAYFVFTGPVDSATGMLINISEIKERAGKILRDRFDHKFLNTTIRPFAMFPRLQRTSRVTFIAMSRRYFRTRERSCLFVT